MADSGRSQGDPDHPRGCGEHPLLLCLFGDGLGSSPRMRGAHCLSRNCRVLRGIIPADAGSTSACHVKGLCATGIIPADAGSTSGKPNILA